MRFITAAIVVLSVRVNALSLSPKSLAVVANEEAIEAYKAGTLTSKQPGVGNNQPELRRNIIMKALADALIGAHSDADLCGADSVHDGNFLRFLESAFVRWESELHSDTSYLAQTDGVDERIALVPFHCTKSTKPRSTGLPAEFACYMSDFETPISSSTAQILRDDLGVVRKSVEHVAAAADAAVYAATVHPGHHAGPQYTSGFCYVNNACVACALLLARGMQPALLDLDFHGGNGSFDCVAEASALKGLWFKSVHCSASYPWVDMAEAAVELPAGTDADDYCKALRATLDMLPASTDVLVVSLGYDTLESDPEAGKRSGGLRLETETFCAIGEALSRACRRVIIVQEGGYDLDAIPAAAQALIRGLTSSCASGSRWA